MIDKFWLIKDWTFNPAQEKESLLPEAEPKKWKNLRYFTLPFEIHFEKSRGLYGDEIKPIEAKLESHKDNHGATTINWIVKNLEDSTREKVKRYLHDGWNQKEIAEQLGINKSSVNYHVKKLENLGVLGWKLDRFALSNSTRKKYLTFNPLFSNQLSNHYETDTLKSPCIAGSSIKPTI